MTITIPEPLGAKLQAAAKRLGYESVDEYIVDLVEGHDETDTTSPLAFKNREEFEALIRAGIESGGNIPVNEAFWAERRRVLEAKIAKLTEVSS